MEREEVGAGVIWVLCGVSIFTKGSTSTSLFCSFSRIRAQSLRRQSKAPLPFSLNLVESETQKIKNKNKEKNFDLGSGKAGKQNRNSMFLFSLGCWVGPSPMLIYTWSGPILIKSGPLSLDYHLINKDWCYGLA